MTISSIEVTANAGVHRYAVSHWHVLQPFVEGSAQDPKHLFTLTDDIWDLWPYARNGISSYAAQYRIHFGNIRSFLKPFVKWYCYQQVLQRPGDLRTTLANLPYALKRTDDYLFDHAYTSLDDLAAHTTFEALWAALLPQKAPPFAPREVCGQRATRPFWLNMSAMFGVPLFVPPVAPCLYPSAAETGLNEDFVIPEPVIAQLTNILGLHREGKCLLNCFSHLRLCILLLHICLGRRISEVLLAPRGSGPEGPLTTYPAHGKGEEGGLWFHFEPNKDGRQHQVYISPEWRDLAQYCVKTILIYSDEVRHLAAEDERLLFILISPSNLTTGLKGHLALTTQHHGDNDDQQGDPQPMKNPVPEKLLTARAMKRKEFAVWLAGPARRGQRSPSVFEQWGITVDGRSTGTIYQMHSQYARHTRQSALAQDPNVSPLIRQRDLNHTSRDMQVIYQHHLREANTKLRERITSHQLHGLGTYWLEECLGLISPGASTAFREGSPCLLDERWRALIVNNPLFVQVNRVSSGLCAFPQGPEGCPEFLHCTETTDEGCAWFLTDPDDIQMQTELGERVKAHRAKQQESQAAGRVVQAHKYEVMAQRTERLRNEALQKASEEVRQALCSELNRYEEEP